MATTNSAKRASAKASTRRRTNPRTLPGLAAGELPVDSSQETNGGERGPIKISLLKTVGAADFLERTKSLGELARNPLYTIDVCYSNQEVLRASTGAPGSLWFDIPTAAVESLTPFSLSSSDPTKVVASIVFRPEFRSLADTFGQLISQAQEVASPVIFQPAGRDSRPPTDLIGRSAAAYDAAEADEDPASPAPGDFSQVEGLDIATARTITNYGAVEPGSSAPPAQDFLEVPEEAFRLETARDFQGPTMPLNISGASSFLNSCINSSPRVRYGLGAKVPFHGATPGTNFTRVDCSGFVREAIWRATTPHLNFRDGSVVQHDWIRTQGFKRSTPDAALSRDGAIRIAFLRPQDAPRGVGHVALVHNAQTLESHGGVGPNSRPWTKTGWQARAFVYFLTPPTA